MKLWDCTLRVFTNGGFLIDWEKAKPRRSVALILKIFIKNYCVVYEKQKKKYLVGDGGGYETPRLLGESKFPECPELLLDVPGTKSILLSNIKKKFINYEISFTYNFKSYSNTRDNRLICLTRLIHRTLKYRDT